MTSIPAVLLHIMAKEELALHEMNAMLNKHSGLIGISGNSNDMRELEKAAAEGDERSALAVEIFCYRVRKYIGAYLAALGGCDYIAFTAGIGENSKRIREECCKNLEFLGIKIDPERNAAMNGKEGLISTDDSRIEVWTIPTNEEMVIARDTVRAIAGGPQVGAPCMRHSTRFHNAEHCTGYCTGRHDVAWLLIHTDQKAEPSRLQNQAAQL